ncbi:MAG: nitroreductase family protein [Candidatus Hydrogenedentota bacterium]
MELFEAIKKRGTVRSYSDKPIPKEDLTQIAEAGRLAPSARNVEPWEFVAITDKNTLGALASLGQNARFLRDAAAAIVVLSKETKYYLEDGAAATQNMLLAATALGIGSCWVAGDKKPYAEDVVSLLGAPEEYKLVSIIALGYAQDEVTPHSKRGVDEVLHFEKF